MHKKLEVFFLLIVRPASKLVLTINFLERKIVILKGYISSRPLNDNVAVDQSIQNMVIRNFVTKEGLPSFKRNRVWYENCFLILNQVLQDLKNNKFEGIAFYSLLQLPRSFKIREKIYKASILKGKTIFFCMENILIDKKNNIEKIEEIIKLQNSLKYCPKNININ